MRRYQRRRRLFRGITPLTLFCFVWSAVITPYCRALASTGEPDSAFLRRLTPDEMKAITGAQFSGGGDPSISYDSGEPLEWEGQIDTSNTSNGNKMTSIPLFGWQAKGGMPVAFSLYHSSKSNRNGDLGYGFSHSYTIYIHLNISNGKRTIHWGDETAYDFTPNGMGGYTSPPGIHDTLVDVTGGYKLTTKNQISYTFDINTQGRKFYCTKIDDRNGNRITLAYTGGFPGPWVLSTVTDSTNRSISLTYTNGRISSVTSPQSRSWSISYNGSGEISQVTWPTVGGNSYNVQLGYDANHCITSFTDLRGKVWTAQFNADRSIAWEKDPYLNQRSYAYYADRTEITDPNSRVSKHYLDASLRLTSEVDPLNNTASLQWDASNNCTRVTDKRAKQWNFTHDSRGNVLTSQDPLLHVTSRTWNTFNDPLTLTTDDGVQAVNTYNATGNLTKTEVKDAQANVVSRTDYVPNADGTLQSKTDHNNRQTLYGYDSNGHLNRITTPNGRVTEITSNVMGVVTSRKDALLRTTNHTLDEWNRVIATDYPTGTDPTFTFDGNSNLTAWTDSTGSWTRQYDDASRILNEKLGGITQGAYVYDATGKKGLLSSFTDESGRALTYAYTDRNQLASVTDSAGTANYAYDADGRETQVTLPNGCYSLKVYDDAGRLTSVTNKNSGGTTLSSFVYGYSDDNVRTSCTELNGDVVSYGYDGAYRLTSESRTGASAYTRTYVVDGVGNRTSQTVGGVTTNFTINSDDELTATSGGFVNAYGYNANGEQTSRTLSGTAYTLGYDFDGQLTSISGGGAVSFAYDALGRRHSRTAAGTTTRFIYGPGGILLEKQGTSYVRTYTPGVRMNSEYPLYDGAGSERTVTASNQSVSGTITFEGFGQTIATTGSSSNPYMFKGGFGYRNDGDAGLHHVGARYYDAQVGRFITRDTVLSQHPYLYCGHDPINAADPSGHIVIALPFAAKLAIAGATALAAAYYLTNGLIMSLDYYLQAGGPTAEAIRQNHWLSQTPFDLEFQRRVGRAPTQAERRKIHDELPKYKEPTPGNDNPDVPPEMAPEIIENLFPNLIK